MTIVSIKSYGKINLSLDILGVLPGGYHQVSMVMHQIALHDNVAVRYTPGGPETIKISTNKPYLPTDERNICYKAAKLMRDTYGMSRSGTIRIDIKKTVPVGAGLAGGSGNCAAVILALNHIWKLGLSLSKLKELGGSLGSDVPFSMSGQAFTHRFLGFSNDPGAFTCGLAEGTGTELKPLPTLKSYITLSKPPISVSTAKAYAGFDNIKDKDQMKRPDTEGLIKGITQKDIGLVKVSMGNVLELYTLKQYYKAMYTKNKMEQLGTDAAIMMSGSGPTIYALTEDKQVASLIYRELKETNRETILTETI